LYFILKDQQPYLVTLHLHFQPSCHFEVFKNSSAVLAEPTLLSCHYLLLLRSFALKSPPFICIFLPFYFVNPGLSCFHPSSFPREKKNMIQNYPRGEWDYFPLNMEGWEGGESAFSLPHPPASCLPIFSFLSLIFFTSLPSF
jgi:hypothetical protein